MYRRYKYGPFDSKIYNYLIELVDKEILLEETEYTATAFQNMEKEQIRRQIWDLMEERSTARFPRLV